MTSLASLLLEVTGAIYKLQQDLPVAKWSFIISAQLLESEALSSVLQNMRRNQGISDRVKELGMQNFRVKLQHRKLTPDPDFPKGRVFAVDSQDQWTLAFPLLRRKESKLIGKILIFQLRTVKPNL